MRYDPALSDWYRGDQARIRQILSNFVSNAVKFTDAGHVLIELSHEGDGRVRIAVEDTGLGVPAEKLPTIFEKFTQVDMTSTRRHQGAGLGLALVAAVAELHGARLTLGDAAPGLRVELALPAAPPGP